MNTKSTYAAASSQPNVLLVVTDDQRWDTAGFTSNGAVHTPSLDRLAGRSLRFTQAYAAYALCSPSRAAILTGQYGSRNGVNGLGGVLRHPDQSIAHTLRLEGYATAVCGKWHLTTSPQDAGFDWAVTFEGNGKWFGRQVDRQGKTVHPSELVDRYCAAESVRFLRERDRKQPFFLFHCTQLPHMDGGHQWPASKESLARYDANEMPLASTWKGDYERKPGYLVQSRNRKQAEKYGYGADPDAIRRHICEYRAAVTDVDDALRPLWEELDAQGLWENTVVIFLSDNGWLLGEHGLTSKVLAYEPSARIPMLISAPGITAGGVDNHLVSNLDIAPTILDLAGLPVPPAMQGISLRPLLTGKPASWREGILYEGIGGYGDVMPMGAWITDRWKVIQTWEETQPPGGQPQFVEVYDLQADPDETKNLQDDAGAASIQQRATDVFQRHPWSEGDTTPRE